MCGFRELLAVLRRHLSGVFHRVMRQLADLLGVGFEALRDSGFVHSNVFHPLVNSHGLVACERRECFGGHAHRSKCSKWTSRCAGGVGLRVLSGGRFGFGLI